MASFKATVLLALLAPVLALPSSLVEKRSSCTHGSRVINGRTYYTSCNADRPGGDYTNTQVSSWDGCIQACSSDTRCVSATYHADNGFCYLKDTLTYESIVSGENTITLGTGCQARNRVISGRQCTVECGTDYHGHDINRVQASSFEACAQSCASNTQCVTAQYRESTGWCYLKDSAGSDVTSDPDVSTISCGSSPTTPTAQKNTPATCPYQSDAYVSTKNCTFNNFCDYGFTNQYNFLSGSAYWDIEGCMSATAANAQFGEAIAFEYVNGYCKIFASRKGLEPGYQVSRPGAVSGFFNKGSCKYQP